MKSKLKWGILAILFSGIYFSSCESYPGEDDYVTEQLVSFTSYDTSVQFKGSGQKFSTYSLGDYIAYIQNKNDGSGKIDTVKVSWDYDENTRALKSQLQKNMNDYLKYTENNTNPDLGIPVSVAKIDNYVVGYNPWWWGGCDWYSWWPCPYYPYYPYSYPVIVGSYTVGTTTINMVDLTNKTSNQKNLVWTGVIRGLMTGTQSQADFNSAINDCFNQTLAFK